MNDTTISKSKLNQSKSHQQVMIMIIIKSRSTKQQLNQSPLHFLENNEVQSKT